MLCSAQSEWEAPTSANNTENASVEKKAAGKESKIKEASPSETKDWKYIQDNAVPEVEGKVVFSYDKECPGKSAQQIYDLAYAALDSIAHSDNQISSSIALINRKEHVIVSRNTEWLEFNKNFLSLDRTKFSYTIIARCADNHISITLGRISYNYEEDRPTGFRTTAEKWITNKYAVNKKRTKLTAGAAKFRKKTIDRKDAIFEYIYKYINR